MSIIPFLRKKYVSKLTPNEILNTFKNNTSIIDWKFSIQQAVQDEIIFEGKISENSFVLGRGKYSLSYGYSSLYPFSYAHLNYNKYNNTTLITVVSRPSMIAVLILSFFYIIAIAGFVIGAQKGLSEAYIVCIIFFITTYSSLIIVFNIWSKKQLMFIEKYLLA